MPSLDPPGGLIPERPDQLTPAWLATVFTRHGFSAAIESIDFRPIEGGGLTSELLRVVPRVHDETTGFAPPLIWKRSSADATARASFQRGYEAEVEFYRAIAPRSGVAVPRSFVAAYEERTGAHVLVLEDLSASMSSGLMREVAVEEAAAVLDELARLHASEWATSGALQAAEDFARLRPFVEEHAAAGRPYLSEHVDDRVRQRTRRYADEVAGYFAALSAGPQTRTHGDVHPDNVLLPHSGNANSGDARPVLIDWQGSRIDAPMRDVARFLVLALTVEDRREHEDELLDHYLATLGHHGAHYDRDAAARDFRTASLLQWGWAVIFFRHEPIWDTGTREAMPSLVRRAAAAFDDAITSRGKS